MGALAPVPARLKLRPVEELDPDRDPGGVLVTPDDLRTPMGFVAAMALIGEAAAAMGWDVAFAVDTREGAVNFSAVRRKG